MEYPLFQKIEEALTKKQETKPWLAGEMKLSTKTVYGFKAIGAVSLENILKLSRILDFNFLEDYNYWLRETGEPAVAQWQEENIVYERSSAAKMTMAISIRGDQSALVNGISKLLITLKSECDKHGLEIV